LLYGTLPDTTHSCGIADREVHVGRLMKSATWCISPYVTVPLTHNDVVSDVLTSYRSIASLSLSLAQANKDSPLETHLYVASYAEQAKAEHVHR